jgi:uncharacterized delta-60 repeat protein
MLRSPRTPLILLPVLLIALFAASAQAQAPLELDSSFGSRGIVSPAHSVPGFEEVGALAVAPGRHIFVAGESVDSPGTVVLARYYRDGELERSFGEGSSDVRGYVQLPDVGPANALLADGARVTLLSQRTTITRLTSGGLVDPSFGQGGSVQMQQLDPALQSLHLWSMASLTGGLIAAAGISFGSPQMVAIRLLPDGKLDPAFNGTGSAAVSFGRRIRSGAVQVKALPDGKLLLAGYADARPALARLLPNGQLDRSFGRGGLVSSPRWLHGRITALTVRRDGSILAGADGSTSRGTGPRAMLLRYSAKGRLDRHFGAVAARRSLSGAAATPIAVVRSPRHIFLATRRQGPSIRAYRLDGQPLPLGKVPGVPSERLFHIAAAPQLQDLILAWTPRHRPGQGVVDISRFTLR